MKDFQNKNAIESTLNTPRKRMTIKYIDRNHCKLNLKRKKHTVNTRILYICCLFPVFVLKRQVHHYIHLFILFLFCSPDLWDAVVLAACC